MMPTRMHWDVYPTSSGGLLVPPSGYDGEINEEECSYENAAEMMSDLFDAVILEELAIGRDVEMRLTFHNQPKEA